MPDLWSGLQLLLDAYDRMVSDAARHLPAEVTAQAAHIGREVRKRRAAAGEFVIVGLLGGTGVGKSSLLNVLADAEVSPAGAFRPTTTEPWAWVPAGAGDAVAAVLETLGIGKVAFHEHRQSVVVLDLPDIDSLVPDHRRRVDEILPWLDLAIWVLDPEKYRDRVLHEEMLRPRAAHHAMFRFVLNQIDRLDPGEVGLVVADLEQALAGDGISDPVVWPVAADPPVGPPLGVEEVWEGITSFPTGGRARSMGRELVRGAALIEPYVTEVGFRSRWDETRQVAATLLAAGGRWEAQAVLEAFVEDLLGSGEDVSLAVEEATGSPDPDRQLDLSLGRVMRERLLPRAWTRALLAEFHLLAGQLGVDEI
jgi:hypothetical protein